jgi:hypothetical protein
MPNEKAHMQIMTTMILNFVITDLYRRGRVTARYLSAEMTQIVTLNQKSAIIILSTLRFTTEQVQNVTSAPTWKIRI